MDNAKSVKHCVNGEPTTTLPESFSNDVPVDWEEDDADDKGALD